MEINKKQVEENKSKSTSPTILPRRKSLNISPLSFAQQRLWFLEQLEPGSPRYHIPLAMRLKGNINIKELERSFNTIVDRHEILRTTFDSIDGKPAHLFFMVISPPHDEGNTYLPILGRLVTCLNKDHNRTALMEIQEFEQLVAILTGEE